MPEYLLKTVGPLGSRLYLGTAQTTPMFAPFWGGLGDTNSSKLFPLIRYFKVKYTTGKAVELAPNDPSIPKDVNLTNTEKFYFIVNGRKSITSKKTIDTINDTSKAKNYLAKHGVEFLQTEAAGKKKDEGFPSDFSEKFSKAMFDHALDNNRSDPDKAVKDVKEIYGVKVEDAPDSLPVFFIYDSIVRGYDKVQHFVRSACEQYFSGKTTTDILQYAKEFKDGLLSTGFDKEDMYANNRGQAYGYSLFKKYHPYRDFLRLPI